MVTFKECRCLKWICLWTLFTETNFYLSANSEILDLSEKQNLNSYLLLLIILRGSKMTSSLETEAITQFLRNVLHLENKVSLVMTILSYMQYIHVVQLRNWLLQSAFWSNIRNFDSNFLYFLCLIWVLQLISYSFVLYITRVSRIPGKTSMNFTYIEKPS